jgi:hypothetical protein
MLPREESTYVYHCYDLEMQKIYMRNIQGMNFRYQIVAKKINISESTILYLT